MKTLLPALFATLAGACAIGVGLHFLFLSRLRSRHPKVWEDLGQPNPFALGPPTALTNHTVKTDFAVLRYLFRKEYRALGDSDITGVADILRIYSIAYFVYFAGTVIFFLVAIGQK